MDFEEIKLEQSIAQIFMIILHKSSSTVGILIFVVVNFVGRSSIRLFITTLFI